MNEENDIRRRLANARARALYWSGNPTFSGKRFNPNHGKRNDEQYELAMCDIDSLCSILEGLTKRKYRRSDPKKAFQDRFLSLMAKHKRPNP